MSKGFWLVTTTVTNPAFTEYVDAFQPWIESVGGSVFAKDLYAQTVEVGKYLFKKFLLVLKL